MTTISKTTFTFTVLHRTDEPFTGVGYDGAFEGSLGEALARSYDGHAVGALTDETTSPVPDERVEEELVQLWNDGEFFDDDLGRNGIDNEEDEFPQTPETARTCVHGNRIWFGNECGLCDSAGVYVWAADDASLWRIERYDDGTVLFWSKDAEEWTEMADTGCLFTFDQHYSYPLPPEGNWVEYEQENVND